MVKRMIVPVVGALMVSGCSFVNLNPKAQDVLLLKPYQARECDQLRRSTSQVLSKIWFINRSKDAMEDELVILAKNTAADLGGNAVVPDSEIVDGKQTFVIYNCQHLR